MEKDLLLRRLTRSGDALPELRRLATSQRGGDRAHYVWAAGMRGRRPATGVAAPPWGCASCRVDPDDNMHEDIGPRPRRVCACLPTASKINVRNRAAHVKSPCRMGDPFQTPPQRTAMPSSGEFVVVNKKTLISLLSDLPIQELSVPENMFSDDDSDTLDFTHELGRALTHAHLTPSAPKTSPEKRLCASVDPRHSEPVPPPEPLSPFFFQFLPFPTDVFFTILSACRGYLCLQ